MNGGSATSLSLPYTVKSSTDWQNGTHDGVVLLLSALSDLEQPGLNALKCNVQSYLTLNRVALDAGCVSLIPVEKTTLKCQRLFVCALGSINRDFDDERCFFEGAQSAVDSALKAGCEDILLICANGNEERYPTARLVSLLGAMQQLYIPLEVRELPNSRTQQATILTLWCNNQAASHDDDELIQLALGLELGRIAARDIGGSDPERMCPMAVAGYVKAIFANSSVIKVTVVEDQQEIKRQYPLMHAVSRAANAVSRHQSRVVKLLYVGKGPIKDTVMLVGKGVTLDTGGLNIKVGGAMYGMSRDKCGAAAVIGFFKTLELLQPSELKVTGIVPLVRNSVGADSYSCDEIITSRSKKRIRVVNTDAEGRMIMLDPLSELCEKAVHEINPHIYTIATLTGHAWLSVGDGYSIAVCNGPAGKSGEAERLRDAGKRVAEMFEISTLRREDYQANKGKTVYEDLLQTNTEPSVRTPRGHQLPAAFLVMGSGLDQHGCDSQQPLKYTHIDIAAGSGPAFPQVPWGGPAAALAARYIMHAYRSERKL